MALTGTDLLLVGRGAVNYKATAADLATFVLSDGTIGLGLNITGRIVKVSIPVASTPPAVGALAAQAVDGSLYWDDNLGQLFIRYANSGGAGGPVWVAAAPPGGGGAAGVTSVGVTTPITNSGTATAPVIAISTATTTARGAVQLATAADAATGTDASKVLTPAFAVPKTPADMTGALYLPGGNDGARPAAATGLLRYNSQGGTPVDLEYYDGAAWTQLATGAGGTLFAFATFGLPAANTYTILRSANIASITVVNSGDLANICARVTFTNPAPDANYSVIATAAETKGSSAVYAPFSTPNTGPNTTTGFDILLFSTAVYQGPFSVAVII
jgi:hypothetical protein